MKVVRWRAVRNAVSKQAGYEINKLKQSSDMTKYKILATWSTTSDSLRVELRERNSHRYFD